MEYKTQSTQQHLTPMKYVEVSNIRNEQVQSEKVTTLQRISLSLKSFFVKIKEKIRDMWKAVYNKIKKKKEETNLEKENEEEFSTNSKYINSGDFNSNNLHNINTNESHVCLDKEVVNIM
ncbi:hypothetical protein CWI37_1681p0010 [Hamiltosporidium tvaerminnensis]|uniref:Uncharacterized protein n=1 Tax=Hamiltosporidium tvaerminnensis TaxID=1176355 RepID=A0A4Q9KW90_9MICR|nr:hypothetical protein CWI37_1681p0010 [Hamiltosporidium tvaerminnensis]